MATIKAYSVARTQRSFDPTSPTSDSGVYSTTTGRQGAYDHPTAEGLVEGRVPTLLNGARSVVNHDVTAMAAITTNADGDLDVRNTSVVATTTTITGSGAGLIVRFTATDADPTQIPAVGNITIVDGGEGYATGNTVEIDGFPGSRLTVTAA